MTFFDNSFLCLNDLILYLYYEQDPPHTHTLKNDKKYKYFLQIWEMTDEGQMNDNIN